MSKTQKEKILWYLRKHRKGITSMKAFWLFRATRLSAIIYDLRHAGYQIQTMMEDNTLCVGKHARYVLIKEPILCNEPTFV